MQHGESRRYAIICRAFQLVASWRSPMKDLYSPHQLVFVFQIHIGRGLVEEDHRGILYYGPGDGNALLLPAGEAGAALADDRSRDPSYQK